jgi:hypothetical protein
MKRSTVPFEWTIHHNPNELERTHHTFFNMNVCSRVVDVFEFYSYDDKLIILEVHQNHIHKFFVFKNIHGHELFWTNNVIVAFDVKNRASLYDYDEIKQFRH